MCVIWITQTHPLYFGGKTRKKIDCLNVWMCMKGKQMTDLKWITEKFRIILCHLWRYSFQQQTRLSEEPEKRTKSRRVHSTHLIHNPINLNLISISMQFLPCFYWQISWTAVWVEFWLNNKRIKALDCYYTFSEPNVFWQKTAVFVNWRWIKLKIWKTIELKSGWLIYKGK